MIASNDRKPTAAELKINEQLRAGEMTQERKAQAYDALIEAMDDPTLGVSIECYPIWMVREDGEFAVFSHANKSACRYAPFCRVRHGVWRNICAASGMTMWRLRRRGSPVASSE